MGEFKNEIVIRLIDCLRPFLSLQLLPR
jgi:hypothetical protein